MLIHSLIADKREIKDFYRMSLSIYLYPKNIK
jgi:hypothetical protein